jgi:hypothetical protein
MSLDRFIGERLDHDPIPGEAHKVHLAGGVVAPQGDLVCVRLCIVGRGASVCRDVRAVGEHRGDPEPIRFAFRSWYTNFAL